MGKEEALRSLTAIARVIMSLILTLTGRSNVLTASYFPPLDLSDDDYELGLTNFETYNTIPNEIRYELDGVEIDRNRNVGITSTIKNYVDGRTRQDLEERRMGSRDWTERRRVGGRLQRLRSSRHAARFLRGL
ncbi:hypothetical protein EAG_12508 [Camponotus floridanus]|uniref:Double jelly roll-like domain-containing protein n=1 Tax=Camponotus floridanus TaxID=104421 RepID=E1ZZK6_CAMFO|nr:hypothetical protein EAG_12508 [Camponotus floridanus]